jgi:VWFA-related protein
MGDAPTICTLLGCLLAASAQQPYRERVDVPRVLMDVRVVDGSGKPVTGLAARDFSVRIDGQAAAVDNVEWVSASSNAEPTIASSPATPEPHGGRSIVLLYQKKPDLTEVEGLMRLRHDVAAFAKIVSPNDRVAVLSFDTSLHLWLDFTSDVQRVRQLMEHDLLVGKPPVAVGAGSTLTDSLSPAVQRASDTIEKSLRLVGEALNPLPGAKSIVVFGYGMGTWLPAFGVVQMAADYEATFFALQRARVSVFCVDLTKADYHPREEGLRLIAEDTGGAYMQSHIFTTAVFDRLADALSAHYVLFVVPPDARQGARTVDVTLMHRKGTVIAKRAYWAQ